MKSSVVVLCGLLAAGQVFAADTQELKTEKDKISYAIGLDIGNSMKRNGIEVDPDILVQGMKALLSGSKPLMTEQEVRTTLTSLQKDLQAKQQEKAKEVGGKNKADGEVFLAKNKAKDGVKTLQSGLQYKVLSEGKGKTPKATDTVTVHYRGTLIDGTEFDSSIKRGEPATFQVMGVIKGWTEALQLMKEGSKWQLFIPSTLAYGEAGAPGGAIGPNAVLIFEVELLNVK